VPAARWIFFLTAAGSFLYVAWRGYSPWALVCFFASGGIWFWLERLKTRELDAMKKRR